MTQKKAKAADMLDGGAKDEASLILDYLRKQNRPYSAIDVSTNLHNKVTKTHAAKVLRELHRKKEIEARVSGAQLHPLQAKCLGELTKPYLGFRKTHGLPCRSRSVRRIYDRNHGDDE